MQNLFIIQEHMSQAQLEQSYLLILAMLNFEHNVDIIFTGEAYNQLCTDETHFKKWSALTMYGVDNLFQLVKDNHALKHNELTAIDQAAFETLKKQADLLS